MPSYEDTPTQEDIKRLVKLCGSVKATAERLGVSRQAVYQWIRGDYRPSKSHRAQINAILLGVADP